jgi:hypothetical protein
MIKIALFPIAIAAYLMWEWPRAVVQASRARRRLRMGVPKVLALHL